MGSHSLISHAHITSSGLYGVAIAASNAWGLFILICLLGYGLVEIPKRLWRSANRELTLRYYQFEVGWNVTKCNSCRWFL